jgi:hypothetical protein
MVYFISANPFVFRFYSGKIIFVVLFYHPPAARTRHKVKMRKFLWVQRQQTRHFSPFIK